MLLLLVAAALLQGTLRFAWLTDLHVGNPGALEKLETVVADINARGECSFVLVTGDITEHGRDEDLQAARSLLNRLTVPFAILPGNHDTKWSPSGGTSFARIFGRERFSFAAGGFTILGFHQGPRMRMADGHLGPEDLRWLDAALTAADRHQPILVAAHYPLDSGISNWYEALDRLRGRDVRMVFVGHGHQNRVLRFEGVAGLMGRSLSRANETDGGYNLVAIAGDSILATERRPGASNAAPWYAGVLQRPRREDPAPVRPSYEVNRRYAHVRERWRYRTGHTVTGGVGLGPTLAVAADAGGRVHALRLDDGSVAWTQETRGSIFGTPAVAGGSVVVASTDSTIRAFRLETGAQVWEVRTDAPVVAAPAVSGGTVFVGSGDGRFRSLDLTTGQVRWSFDSVAGFVETRPTVYGERVYFGAWDNTLYALDTRDGMLRWRWKRNEGQVLLSPAACWPVAAAGRIFVVAPDRVMTALDAGSGRELWRSRAHQVRESIGGSEDGSLVFVRTMRDSLIAFEADADAQRLRWATHAGFGYDINAAMPVEREGTLFYGTMKGFVYALDARSGALRWIHRVGPSAVNTVTPLSASSVLCTDFDGTILLLETAEGG